MSNMSTSIVINDYATGDYMCRFIKRECTVSVHAASQKQRGIFRRTAVRPCHPMRLDERVDAAAQGDAAQLQPEHCYPKLDEAK